MAEGNGGELTVGKRLERIEQRLEAIEEHMDTRISRHKEANDKAIKELATSIVRDFGERVTKLETTQTSEEKVKEALEKHQAKQTATFRWVMGFIASLGLVNLLVNLQQGAG